MPAWLQLCLSKSVIKRAFLSALVVGIILITINHGDALLRGQVDQDRLLKMLLTICVPYLVSTFSSVSTILQMQKQQANEELTHDHSG